MKGLLLAILIIDLPPSPYEPHTTCTLDYQLNQAGECIKVEQVSCLLEEITRCDFKCYMNHWKYGERYRGHRFRRWNHCTQRDTRKFGIQEIIMRDDGVVVGTSDCERQ